MPHVREADRKPLLSWMEKEDRPAPVDPSYVPECVWADFLHARIADNEKETPSHG